jgi:hypothetical protein
VGEVGSAQIPIDLREFNRVIPAIHDPRLVLEAPNKVARRALYMAIKISQSHVRSHLHITPQEKANKTLAYFTARRYPVRIDDRGDIICMSWHSKPAEIVRVDIRRSAAEIEQ